MNFSDFFVGRPRFAVVLSILIFVAGLIALPILPIAEYPEVVPPTVVVRTAYAGADPAVIAETVAARWNSRSTAWRGCSTSRPRRPPTAPWR